MGQARSRNGSAESDRPLFSFGVITDVQYADVPNGHSFAGVPRYYRHSLTALREAVAVWNQQADVSFVVHLGDIVDVHCPRSESLSAITKLVSEFDSFQHGPSYHLLGNHCLYNLPRYELNRLLRIPSADTAGCSSYYTVKASSTGFRLVFLDTYDVSVLGWPEEHPHARAARRILEGKNPNRDKNSSKGMPTRDRRYVMFNGGVGEEQMKWLEGVLVQAKGCGEKVIVCSHVPLDHEASSENWRRSSTLVWNSEEVMGVIQRFKGVVVACLAGHRHSGGYSVDSGGIHHRVLEAVLECPPGKNAFGRVDVYGDRICLVGSGRMRSTTMRFTP